MEENMNLPNTVTSIRIALIPVFVAVFFTFEPVHALILFVLIQGTDVVDGYLARKNKQITKLGQILDPLADKLLQIAAITCLFIKSIAPLWFIILLGAKELIMIVVGFSLIHTRGGTIPAKWYGKLTTVIIFLSIASVFIFWRDNMLTDLLFIVAAVCSIFSFVNYGLEYLKIIHSKKIN